LLPACSGRSTSVRSNRSAIARDAESNVSLCPQDVHHLASSCWKILVIGATHCKGAAANGGHQSCGIEAGIDGVIMWGSIVSEWASLILRWLHVVAAIAWIGSSFYFIALDLSLKPNSDLPNGVQGEAWQVHGGGFYRIMKYLVAPSQMPDEL